MLSVIVADDEKIARRRLTRLIHETEEAKVVAACAGGKDAITQIIALKPQILFLDVQMPGMTGPELHNRLVSSGEPIPTILITAFPDDRARERALQAGVIGYLTKPFSEDDLLACIRSNLGAP